MKILYIIIALNILIYQVIKNIKLSSELKNLKESVKREMDNLLNYTKYSSDNITSTLSKSKKIRDRDHLKNKLAFAFKKSKMYTNYIEILESSPQDGVRIFSVETTGKCGTDLIVLELLKKIDKALNIKLILVRVNRENNSISYALKFDIITLNFENL
jgi:predicted RNase H-like nuclease (RuvC/YqgF family)